jgi:hypothetical protein
MLRARALLPAFAVMLTASVVSAQPYEPPPNPLRMQVRGWLGAVFGDQPVAAGGPGDISLVVTEVTPGSPASLAGFARGDILTNVGRLSVRDVLAQGAGGASSTAAVTEALTRMPGASRVKFRVVRGGHPIDLFVELTGSAERRLIFLTLRERSTHQLRRIDAATRQLATTTAEYEQARLTGSLGPVYREYTKLLQEIIGTGDADVLDALANDAFNDGRLEVVHRLIAFLQLVAARRISIPSAHLAEYRAFNAGLETLVPSRAHFDRTLGALTARQLVAARAALLFVEPYADAKDRLAQVEQRLGAHQAASSDDARLAALKGELLSSLQSGVRDQALEDRIARLPPESRRALEEFRSQMLARRAQADAAAAQAAADRRKLEETNDAIFQQMKEARRQKEEAERQERERIAAEQSEALRQHGVTHVTFGEDLYANPFRFQGQTVCLKDLRFRRMINSSVGLFQTRTGRQLIISRVPVDAFKEAGQRHSVLAKVVTTAGKSPTLELSYVALLPEPEGN